MPRLLAVLLLTAFISTSSEARVCHSDPVTGRVVSPTAIVVGEFMCRFAHFTSRAMGDGQFYRAKGIDQGVLIHVVLKNPEDLNAMQPGDLVKVKGHFTAESPNGRNRLTVTDAELIR
jgi:hypothetical protein